MTYKTSSYTINLKRLNDKGDTNPIDNPSAYYHFLRKQMPFRIHPAQINGSRIAGYLAWYGGYVLPYKWCYRLTCLLFRKK